MILKRPVKLLAVMTDAFRQQQNSQLQQTIDAQQQELDALEIHARQQIMQAQTQDLPRGIQMRGQWEQEKGRREGLIQQLKDQQQALKELKDGELVEAGVVEGQVEVQVDDNLRRLMGSAALVVRDDVVQEIRE